MHCLGRVSDLGRLEWLSLRRTGLGASDIPCIMGRSPFGSPLSVYAEKVLPAEEGEDEPDLLKWGRMVQPVIMQWLAEEAMIKIKNGDVMFRSAQVEYMTATVDGTTADPGTGMLIPVEAKVTAWKERDWVDGVPDYVYLQVQAQMYVCEADYAYVVACLGGQPPVWIKVARSQDTIDDILKAAAEFWGHVQEGKPPEPEGLEASSQAIKKLYPGGNSDMVPLFAEYNDIDIKREAAKLALKNLQKTERYLTDKIKMAIRDSAGGVLTDGTRFTWKRDKHGTRRFHRSPARET